MFPLIFAQDFDCYFDLSNQETIIQNGILKQGILDKQVISDTGVLIQRCCKRYSDKVAAHLIDNLIKTSLNFLKMFGSTYSDDIGTADSKQNFGEKPGPGPGRSQSLRVYQRISDKIKNINSKKQTTEINIQNLNYQINQEVQQENYRRPPLLSSCVCGRQIPAVTHTSSPIPLGCLCGQQRPPSPCTEGHPTRDSCRPTKLAVSTTSVCSPAPAQLPPPLPPSDHWPWLKADRSASGAEGRSHHRNTDEGDLTVRGRSFTLCVCFLQRGGGRD